MARIRTIKPEFPQSESMGRVSREARLLFVQLWPICDDHGRTRAASRMLASLLYPYDDDAKELIEEWLAELEAEKCIELYEVDGSRYLQVCNWLKHQKIDKPSKPQHPGIGEGSRVFANLREGSRLLLGREGKGREGCGEAVELTTPPSHDDEREPDSDASRPRRNPVELKTWIESLDGEDAIPADDPIFVYAQRAGIPFEYLELSWLRFQEDMAEKHVRKRDWRAHYRNAVKGNWYRLWWITPEGECRLTTQGEQQRRAA